MKNLMMTTIAATTLLAGSVSAENMIDPTGVLLNENDITIPSVVADADGYVVLHEVVNGEVVAPASVGHTAITAGENTNVVIASDIPLPLGTSFVAMLHAETNGNDTYDFAEGMTDVDTPVMKDGAAIVQPFKVSEAMVEMSGDVREEPAAMDTPMQQGGMTPMIDTTGLIVDGTMVKFEKIDASADGYIVIHEAVDGVPVVPASIGHTAINAGENTLVEVIVERGFEAGKSYVAMLHVESNNNTTYDFGKGQTTFDTPVTLNGEVVAVPFNG